MIPHSNPSIGDTDIQSVLTILRSGRLVQGEQVDHFEKELSSFIGVQSAAAVNSGTAALHLALLALDVQTGDEIIIPSFSCSALLNAVRYTGARPVLADINDRDYNLSVEDVQKRITSKTRAIIVPHLFGQPADIEELMALGVPVIEDCAQSLGSRYQGKMTGGFGHLAIFSFYATKLITTGEGGMVASNHHALIKRIIDLRDYDEKDDGRLRYNYKMTDIQAALGRSQLRQLPIFLAKRTAIADRYNRTFQDMGMDIPKTAHNRDHIYFRYVIRHEQAESLIDALNNGGIACRRPIYRPLHHYIAPGEFPLTERVWHETLSLPIYPSLTDMEISFVISSFTNALQKG